MLIVGLNNAPLKGLENFISYLYENEWRDFICYDTVTKKYMRLYGFQIRERMYNGEMINGYTFYGNGYYYNENWNKDVLFHTLDNGYAFQYENMRIKWVKNRIYYAKSDYSGAFQGFIFNSTCIYIKHILEPTYNCMKDTGITMTEDMFLESYNTNLVLKLRLLGY